MQSHADHVIGLEELVSAGGYLWSQNVNSQNVISQNCTPKLSTSQNVNSHRAVERLLEVEWLRVKENVFGYGLVVKQQKKLSAFRSLIYVHRKYKVSQDNSEYQVILKISLLVQFINNCTPCSIAHTSRSSM